MRIPNMTTFPFSKAQLSIWKAREKAALVVGTGVAIVCLLLAACGGTTSNSGSGGSGSQPSTSASGGQTGASPSGSSGGGSGWG